MMTTNAAEWRLDVARELIETLDTLTPAGQRHTMGKIVRVLDDESSDEIPLPQIGALRDDLSKMAPDIESFSRRARAIVAGLVRAARFPARRASPARDR
jgi:hypothetical protein